MLGLSRKPGESVIIGGNIRVKIVDVRGNKVKLAIYAPKHVSVWREEIQPPVNNDVQPFDRLQQIVEIAECPGTGLQQPRWHDKPTGPGRWYGGGAIWNLNEDAVAEWHSDTKYDSYPRMFGPIPDDEGEQ